MFNESLRKKTFSIKQTITKSKSNTAAAAAAAAAMHRQTIST